MRKQNTQEIKSNENKLPTEKTLGSQSAFFAETPVSHGKSVEKDMELYLKLHIANHRPG